MKAPAKKPATSAIRMPDRMHASVSVRKIDNGYVITESCDGPRGYTSTERYSPTKPKITMPSAVTPKKK